MLFPICTAEDGTSMLKTQDSQNTKENSCFNFLHSPPHSLCKAQAISLPLDDTLSSIHKWPEFSLNLFPLVTLVIKIFSVNMPMSLFENQLWTLLEVLPLLWPLPPDLACCRWQVCSEPVSVCCVLCVCVCVCVYVSCRRGIGVLILVSPYFITSSLLKPRA